MLSCLVDLNLTQSRTLKFQRLNCRILLSGKIYNSFVYPLILDQNMKPWNQELEIEKYKTIQTLK